MRSRRRYSENCECVDTLSTPRFHREVAQDGILSQQLGMRFPEGFPPAMKKKSAFVEQSMKWFWGFRGLEDNVDTKCNKKKRDDNFSNFWILYMNPTLGLSEFHTRSTFKSWSINEDGKVVRDWRTVVIKR